MWPDRTTDQRRDLNQYSMRMLPCQHDPRVTFSYTFFGDVFCIDGIHHQRVVPIDGFIIGGHPTAVRMPQFSAEREKKEYQEKKKRSRREWLVSLQTTTLTPINPSFFFCTMLDQM